MFVSFCKEANLKVWSLVNRECKMFHSFKINKPIDFMHVFMSNEHNFHKDRFLIAFTSGETELFEFDAEDKSLYYLETDKNREHDTRITGCDYNKQIGLLVTSDGNGMIRLWNRDKKFLREI